MAQKPSHKVYYARALAGEDKKDQLTAIGAAWPHTKGEGFGLVIDVPLAMAPGDRLVLLELKEKDAA